VECDEPHRSDKRLSTAIEDCFLFLLAFSEEFGSIYVGYVFKANLKQHLGFF
jgi:hypothetical protein